MISRSDTLLNEQTPGLGRFGSDTTFEGLRLITASVTLPLAGVWAVRQYVC
jgi:hypothetical protein